jgi:hypothetical protein
MAGGSWRVRMRDVKRWQMALAGLLLAGSAGLAAAHSSAAAVDDGALQVTVHYKGQGSVDKSHQIIVWLFDTPDITENSTPLANDVVTSNGGSVGFTGLPKTVYIAAAYNEKGDYDAGQGPPPTGTPVTIYGGQGTAAGVATGADSTVSVDFDDTMRMP